MSNTCPTCNLPTAELNRLRLKCPDPFHVDSSVEQPKLDNSDTGKNYPSQDQTLEAILQNFAVCRDYIGSSDFEVHLLLCFGDRDTTKLEIDDLFTKAITAITEYYNQKFLEALGEDEPKLSNLDPDYTHDDAVEGEIRNELRAAAKARWGGKE